MIWIIFILITCVKFLFIPAYRSTDFEVHRNWLAITHSKPIYLWYFENTSEWTLDYPPFFAWFEFMLSHIAKYFDPNMLNVKNLNYASDMTVLFQRLSVMVTDLLLLFGTRECSNSLGKSNSQPKTFLAVLILCNAGLFMVDHIHFQYNGMLYGILLLSISCIMKEQYLMSALWFSILLNLKHIFAYVAPAYVVYLLGSYCLQGNFDLSKTAKRISKLVLIGFITCTVSFGPFIRQISQVMARLFPFKRGLCHAYWAPNFWAIYNVADKASTITAKKLGYSVSNSTATMTGGLVEDVVHTTLPTITPSITFYLTFITIVPALIKLWRIIRFNKTPIVISPLQFIRCLVICGACSFLFGWHVHEKAILMLIIPMSISAVLEKEDAKIFLMLSTIGHYSLFPLLFTNELLLPKALIFISYSGIAFKFLSQLFPESNKNRLCLPLLNILESMYIYGLGFLFIYENFLHKIIFKEKLPFLPLLLTSLYCAMGVMYSVLCFYKYFLCLSEGTKGLYKKKRK
ncbi:probable dolichyl pyrophosphate Glc1Man9GlcNAc2 alpha-1,3-glucosyltransferase [Ctenocephalides felis]|uniref:probable dolichyl pyrophosphate Glc1Man9GlcNAc2 alpha-1,3-glucosyltransferase n=1 Tax=Ctenocephalides felis TaxID=7515 RepID=UPI000E6E37C0|nr:probable dolichyl pyrophosphate Glc1Man9GlcNAc2 alpha-1,3-glucosyltransferase [Ctenocephalides felis]